MRQPLRAVIEEMFLVVVYHHIESEEHHVFDSQELGDVRDLESTV